ncbi:Glycosyl hydrolases family 28 [Lutibacter oricola]|uniref:Glycosyl hydrolases family 28 n=1 Tax=Lutibacter oricola TaxID=762486 RepID=A0A1H2SV33_9FLAO|nr:glycosyl hydrolase family 28 protein [Lutibacter oricola]SDW35430.1 Glycosyl hydrolases family 28 [Lutibacter oricola]
MNKLKLTLLLTLLTIVSVVAKEYNIATYGAINDGKTVNTIAVQKAIDDCNKNGGGTVMIDGGGIYVIGTIFMKSNVTLHVDNGTVLQGSANQNDYPLEGVHKNMYKGEISKNACLIYAENATSIAFEGHGTIDGNGHYKNFPRKAKIMRPMLIRLKDCSNISLRDIHLINPAAWTSAFLYCNNITVDGITIISRANFNGDGLDFDGCQNVRVSNSNFDNSDDCICLQTSLPEKPCRNVTITNCNFTTKWGGIRIGLLSRGDIEYVTVSNCTFRDIQDSGLKIQQNEGGNMSHMTFSNLVMENVPRPIFMTFCQQIASVETPNGEYEPLKRMHNMKFDNIIVDNSKGDKHSAFFLTGIPGHEIEDISISNVDFIVSGGGTIEDAGKLDVKEYTLDNMKRWPEFYVVEGLPAYGIYARHLNGLNLQNISIKTNTEDKRVPVILNHVKNHYGRNLKANGKVLKKSDILIQN